LSLKKIATAAAVAALTFSAAGTAQAASWHPCRSNTGHVVWHTYSGLMTSHLRARSPMNCASARSALRFVQHKYAAHGRLPGSFYDGYVTWSGYSLRNDRWSGAVQYEEYDSNTRFRFDYVEVGD
jgi:hypothetical protein